MQHSENLLNIVYYPGAILRKKAAPVERITPEMSEFIARMADTMYESNGVGLAAPQVGIALRIIVVDVDDCLHAVINPVIIASEGSQTGIEGCLSLPGLHGDVTRAQRVTVRGLNLQGKRITLSGEGMWARCMQHEIDHLDGVLFIDRVLPETLHWVTGETDANGHLVERPTTLDEAMQIFERQMALSHS